MVTVQNQQVHHSTSDQMPGHYGYKRPMFVPAPVYTPVSIANLFFSIERCKTSCTSSIFLASSSEGIPLIAERYDHVTSARSLNLPDFLKSEILSRPETTIIWPSSLSANAVYLSIS